MSSRSSATTADERRLQPVAPTDATPFRHHPYRLVGDHPLRLALDLVLAGGLELDRLLCGLVRPGSHQHRARVGGGLQPGGDVDVVTGHHGDLSSARPHRRVAGVDADAEREVGSGVGGDLGDRVDQLQPGSHRPLGVVLVRLGGSPHSHHRIADELLHDPAELVDDPLVRSK